jgi:hypothetical protein
MSFRIQIWFELKIIFDLEKCLKIRKVFLYIKQDLGVSFSFLLPGPAQPTSFPHTPAHCVQSSSASHHCSSASPTAASALPDALTGFAQPGLTPKHSQALEAKPIGPGCVTQLPLTDRHRAISASTSHCQSDAPKPWARE